MPMPKVIHDALQGSLKDSKVVVDGKDVLLIDVISEWQDGYDAKGKVQQANREISAERDALKDELKIVKKTLSDSASEVERLQKNALTDDDKKKLDEYKKKGMTTEVEGKINTLASQIETISNQLKAAETDRQNALAQAATARKQTAETSLRNELTTALTAVKIVKNAKFAMNSIIMEGMAKVEEKDGNFANVYTYIKDGKPFSVGSVKELAEAFAKDNEQLVDSSGNRGTGKDTGDNTGGGNTGNALASAKTRQEILQAADRMMQSGLKRK